MTTIREQIIDVKKRKLAYLETMKNSDDWKDNPIVEMVCVEQRKAIDEADKKIKGLKEFGNHEILKQVVKTGKRGKEFLVFETTKGKILYFPNAVYGAFLKKEDPMHKV